MMEFASLPAKGANLDWVPIEARNYLAHTVQGRSIRAIARDQSCHPSTILRQVRRYEARRDCPLVDAALKALSPEDSEAPRLAKEITMTTKTLPRPAKKDMKDAATQRHIDREALMVLRRLCERGAVLAVARDMDAAGVVREDGEGGSIRTAVVGREIAQALALKEWINSAEPEARVARYFITSAGREALRHLTAEEENRAQGFKQDGRERHEGDEAWDLRHDLGGGSRYMVTESPLIGLARRRDKDGQKFLSREQVDAGERIRQDFELSQIRLDDPSDWRAATDNGYVSLPKASQEARDRLTAALEELGPGLCDIVLRCCCFLEGLEVTEKTMGWSARSGKIVLRIALTRLIKHYHDTQGKFAPMIG